MNPAYPGLAAAALYLIGALLQTTTLVRKLAVRRDRLLLITTAAVVLHAVTEYLVVNQPAGFGLGAASVVSLIALTLAVFVLVVTLWQPLENLFVVILPLGALAVIGSVFGHQTIAPRSEFGEGLLGHILISIVAYTVLAMAAVQSVMLALQERSLRHRGTLRWVRLLPPLQTMETMLFQLLWLGLVALSLSIGSGFLFLGDMFAASVVSHTILASASWITFAVLLAGRYAFGWRSTLATRATLVGFLLLVLAYFASRFVLELVLGRA